MSIKDDIAQLADRFATELKRNIDLRVADMEKDDRSHVLIYQVLGISEEEGKLIDVYQNKGRFLYKYAGSFLEEAAKLCFKQKFPDSGPLRVPNTVARARNFSVWIVSWVRMLSRSSGETRRPMVTTSLKSTREYRQFVMLDTNLSA